MVGHGGNAISASDYRFGNARQKRTIFSLFHSNRVEYKCLLWKLVGGDVLVNNQTRNDDKYLWYHAGLKVCCVKGIENLVQVKLSQCSSCFIPNTSTIELF